MFVVFLRFSNHQERARELMPGHVAWLEQGFAEGAFLLSGSIEPGVGGAIVAHDTTRAQLEERVQRDPFVQHDVVAAEIVEITPSRTAPPLEFLKAART